LFVRKYTLKRNVVKEGDRPSSSVDGVDVKMEEAISEHPEGTGSSKNGDDFGTKENGGSTETENGNQSF